MRWFLCKMNANCKTFACLVGDMVWQSAPPIPALASACSASICMAATATAPVSDAGNSTALGDVLNMTSSIEAVLAGVKAATAAGQIPETASALSILHTQVAGDGTSAAGSKIILFGCRLDLIWCVAFKAALPCFLAPVQVICSRWCRNV